MRILIKWRVTLITLAFVLCPLRLAMAANVAIVKDHWGEQIIDIIGKIQKGDALKIKQLSHELIKALPEYKLEGLHYHLNTDGGDVEEAIQIGRFFREILGRVDSYGTIIIAPGSEDEKLLINREEPWRSRDYRVIPPDAPLTEDSLVRNYSAGILIFYGAVQRSHRDNSDQRLGFTKQKTIPVMGIHRPYYEREAFAQLSPAQAAEAYGKLETTVRTYLIEMGAPQALLDRMFARSSAEVELVPAEEFRKFYRPEESFLQEWLNAKCGVTGDYANLLQGKESEDFRKIEAFQIRAHLSGNQPIGTIYPDDPNFSDSYVNELYEKVRNHNRRVESCRQSAITTHQREWAKEFEEQSVPRR